MKQHRFITIGELLLRLTPPDHHLFVQADTFEACYGGSEANIALLLASLGIDSSYMTIVPDHSIGHASIQSLQRYGVNCSNVIFASKQEAPSFRLGTYYLEKGYGVRASRVVYDRMHSALTEYDLSRIDLKEILKQYTWLHLSGITPALNDTCRTFILDALQTAKQLGLVISFDGNYRSALWSWEEARDFCTMCLPYVNVLFGIEPYHLWNDTNDHTKGDVKDTIPFHPTLQEQEMIFESFHKQYPNLTHIVRHVRTAISGNVNQLKAYLWHDGKTMESESFTFDILDRVGGGDAFAAGYIYAAMKEFETLEGLNFAVACSVMKHTIHGDAYIDADETLIRNIMNQNFDIKR